MGIILFETCVVLQSELDFCLIGFSVQFNDQGECHEKPETTFYT